MKITEIKVYLLQKKLSSSMCISRGGFQVRNHTIVEVKTDSGLTGLGEGVGNAGYIKSLLEGPIGQLAIGLDPFEIEKVRKKLLDDQVYFERMGSAICAASAIEMACWDIKGKALELPVYELMGGLYRDKLEPYASDVYWEEDPRKMIDRVNHINELGIKNIKAHIGYLDARQDLERVKVLRESLNENHKLMIDLNAGYSYTEALRASRLWEPYELTWLEEPLNPNLRERMGDLNQKSLVPIAAGENEFLIHGFKDLFDKKAVDIAMPDIARVGGLQETKNICGLAESYGITVSPHNYSSGILLAATMQLMASTPNCELLEYDASSNAVYHELFIDPLKFDNGLIKVQRLPGFGVELKKEIIEKYAVQTS